MDRLALLELIKAVNEYQFCYSRDKKDIKELGAGLDFVKELKPVEFVWNDR